MKRELRWIAYGDRPEQLEDSLHPPDSHDLVLDLLLPLLILSTRGGICQRPRLFFVIRVRFDEFLLAANTKNR